MQYVRLSTAHTMPSVVALLAEMEGVAPGKPKETAAEVAKPGLNIPVVVVKG